MRKIKPSIKFILALVVIAIFMSFINTPYKMNGMVVEDNGSSVVVETTNGHLWEVLVDYNTFQEGDEVIVEIANQGDPNKIVDDKVVDIYKK